MKKLFVMLILLSVLAFPVYSVASPIYLTLEGTVYAQKDGGGLVKGSGIKMGDTVSYVVKIDTDIAGSFVNRKGNVQEARGSIFSSLESSSALQGDVKARMNWGRDSVNRMFFQAGNDNSNLYGQDYYKNVGALKVGSSINDLFEISFGQNGRESRIDLRNVKVTRVAETAPTPIPGAVLLLGGGLGVVGFIRRKFARS